MLSPSVNIGPFTIHLYGFIIGLSIYTGYTLAKKRAHLYKIPKSSFDDPLLILPLLLSAAGARLYHVLDYWSLYSQNLISIFFIQNGGLGIWGALGGVVLGFYIFAKIRKLNFPIVLDLLSPSLLLGQAIGRIGNYVNQEGFGPPTNLPWGVYINLENRPPQYLNKSYFHPTFFYEAIIDLIFFIILLYLAQKLKIRGQVFALYLILYSLGRFVVEFWRIDTATVGQIKIAHFLALISFCIGIMIFLQSSLFLKTSSRKN